MAKTALEYYQDFQKSVDAYDDAYELYSGEYDDYIGSFYMGGLRLSPSQFGGVQSFHGQEGMRYRDNFVSQFEQGFGTYARTGDVRQAELVSDTTGQSGYGFRGRQRKVYRDPITGMTYETPQFNTKQGVEFSDGTFGFSDGTIIGLVSEPEFSATAPVFDKARFEELADQPLQNLQNLIDQENLEIEKIKRKREEEDENFRVRFAKMQEDQNAELAKMEANTLEAQASVARQQELLESETNEILKRTGRRKTAMVRARTLRGRPILSGENA